MASSSLGHVCLFFLLSLVNLGFLYFFFFLCLLHTKGQKTRLSTNKKESVCLKKDVACTFTVSLSLSLFLRARVCVYIFMRVYVYLLSILLSVLACVCVCLCF